MLYSYCGTIENTLILPRKICVTKIPHCGPEVIITVGNWLFTTQNIAKTVDKPTSLPAYLTINMIQFTKHKDIHKHLCRLDMCYETCNGGSTEQTAYTILCTLQQSKVCYMRLLGGQQSLDWTNGLDWWTGLQNRKPRP